MSKVTIVTGDPGWSALRPDDMESDTPFASLALDDDTSPSPHTSVSLVIEATGPNGEYVEAGVELTRESVRLLIEQLRPYA